MSLQSSTPGYFHFFSLLPRWGKKKSNQLKPLIQTSSIFYETIKQTLRLYFTVRWTKAHLFSCSPFPLCIQGCPNQNLQFGSSTQLHLVLSFCLQTVSKIRINCMICSPICIFLSTSQCIHQKIFIAAGVQKKGRIMAWFALISMAIFCTLFIKC